MLVLDSYEAEKDAARAKTPSKTPLVSEIQTSTVQQIIEKTVNRSAGIMAMQSDLMQPEAVASQAPVSAAAAPKAAASEPKPALSGHKSGSGCEDEQRKPPPANLPTTASALPKDATLATTDATTPSVKSAAASGSITIKALLLINKEAALEISNPGG